MAEEQNTTDARPLGVFDSGVGGLTVVAALKALLPHEHIIYLGDTARVPYGNRSAEVVRRYSARCAKYLLDHGAKMLVVACNTASAFALGDLQMQLTVPVLGVIEAGAALAASQFAHGRIAVLATEGTIASRAYQKALARLAPKAEVTAIACPMFVPLCEEGLVDHPATRLLADMYLAPLVRHRVDAVVLGCTHYPLLAPLLQKILGKDTTLIDSAHAVATAVANSLDAARMRRHGRDMTTISDPEQLRLCVTDLTSRTKRVAAQFLGHMFGEVTEVNL